MTTIRFTHPFTQRLTTITVLSYRVRPSSFRYWTETEAVILPPVDDLEEL